MQLQINEESLPVYEALASKTRIKIIQLLSKKDECQRFGKRTWSEQCYHDDAREKARGSKHHQNRKSRTTKISSLRVDKIDISFPEKIFNAFDTKETSIPIGHYTNYAIEPTCGLATIHDFIEKVDEPRYFMDPRRMDARILWFTSGFVEYQAPNF